MQVCGIESIHARRPDDYEAALLEHSKKLNAAYKQAALVFCIESNLGFESSHIAHMVKGVPFGIIMYESKSGVPGMCTTHNSKEVMCNLLTEKLRENAVAFAEKLVTTAADPEKMRQELLTQLSNYSVIVDRPDKMTQHFRFAKKTYSGKPFGNDDLAVMLQFNLLAHNRFFANVKYRAMW